MNKHLESLSIAMQQQHFYPHPVANIQRIETHISMLFLTGDLVYKIKKPVDFGFLNFTELADRKHFCEEEVRINRRTAPSLYLEVVPIYANAQGYSFKQHNSDDAVIEYAVKMRQFDTREQFDLLLEQGAISLEDIEALATEIARFHGSAERAASNTQWGTAEILLEPCLENIDLLQSDDADRQSKLQNLKQWTQQNAQKLATIFVQRKGDKVRECHGDMHLANIARIEGQLTLFDAIEFSEKLRWIDVASDLAFLLMDLESHKHDVFSNHLLNHYLSLTGDFELIQVLRFYKVYRALVRAKVAYLQTQESLAGHYLTLANRYTRSNKPCLLITFGLSGSGKSWGSRNIANQFGLIHIRSDIERKRLAGMLAHDREQASSAFGTGLYSQKMSNKTYDELARIATMLLNHSQSVIVDATFLKREERDAFAKLAMQQNAEFTIFHFTAELTQLEENIRNRAQRNDDASDADVAVLHKQLTVYDTLHIDEPVIEIPFGKALPETDIRQFLSS